MEYTVDSGAWEWYKAGKKIMTKVVNRTCLPALVVSLHLSRAVCMLKHTTGSARTTGR